MSIRQLNIRNRLLTGFLLLGLMVTLLGLTALRTMAEIRSVTTEIEENTIPSLETLAGLNLAARLS